MEPVARRYEHDSDYSRVGEFDVHPRERVDLGTTELARGGRIQGRITGLGPRRERSPTYVELVEPQLVAEPDDEGFFSFDHVPAGSCRIRRFGVSKYKGDSLEVEIQVGETTVLELPNQ